MKNMIVSAGVLAKLRDKHQISRREVEQCFENLCGEFLEDSREDHRTDPPTLWFIGPTNRGRLLKVVFLFRDGNAHIKTAFEPEQKAIDIYDRHAK